MTDLLDLEIVSIEFKLLLIKWGKGDSIDLIELKEKIDSLDQIINSLSK